MLNLKPFLGYLVCALISNLYGQSNLPLTINHAVIDTIETRSSSELVNMLWLNDTVQVRIKNKIIKIDSAEIRKMRIALKDSSYGRTQKQIDNIIAFAKIGAQNCYSYAIEKYFENNKIFNQHLFNSFTHLKQDSAEKIIANYFTEVDRFSTSPKRNFKRSIPDDTLLAFTDKYDNAIHFVFYTGGVFHTKNGGLEPKTFQSLKKFLKTSYWDTEEIIFYKINAETVKQILVEKDS